MCLINLFLGSYFNFSKKLLTSVYMCKKTHKIFFVNILFLFEIAIIGSGIGGCSTAYFLEDYFKNDKNKKVQIDIFEKNSKIGGNLPFLNYNGSEYDINVFYANSFHSYMNHFSKISGMLKT